MDSQLLFRISGPLEKLTNEEFYYIISALLGLGDPGFLPERLYLSFDQASYGEIDFINFLLLTKTMIDEGDCDKEITEYHLGKIDCEFDDIEIYSGRCNPSELDPETDKIDPFLIASNLRERPYPKKFRPITFIKGINRILSQSGFDRREDNHLFNFFTNSPVPSTIAHEFDFGKIVDYATNFSGNYFLIVEPDSQSDGLKVNSFQVRDNFDPECPTDYVQYGIDVTNHFIDVESIQQYEQGKSDRMFKVERGKKIIENPTAHKERILPVLTETVLSLLVDLSPSEKKRVLENETPEEVVVFCKEKYDTEFDQHFDSLGIAGAHEIAWEEALAILRDDSDEEGDEPF